MVFEQNGVVLYDKRGLLFFSLHFHSHHSSICIAYPGRSNLQAFVTLASSGAAFERRRIELRLWMGLMHLYGDTNGLRTRHTRFLSKEDTSVGR
jgi:hypothetical protein